MTRTYYLRPLTTPPSERELQTAKSCKEKSPLISRRYFRFLCSVLFRDLYYYYVICVIVQTGFNNLKYVKLIVENTFMITSNHLIIRLHIQLEWPRMRLCINSIMLGDIQNKSITCRRK